MAPFYANAASVSPVFVDYGLNTSSAQGTRVFGADLSGLGLTEIRAITITDSNSGLGGSGGIYSGFDLDAMFLDVDGDLTTTADRYFASGFEYSAGTARPGSYAPPSPSGGPMNGAFSPTQVDTGWATLNDIDAIWFGQGSLSLGDGGILTAVFDDPIQILSSLYLFVGEVSGDPGEMVTGSIKVADQVPPVPLPATAPLLMAAVGFLAFRRRRG